MSPAFLLLAFLVKGWAWLYTCGLPVEVAQRRRAEIQSDLWELEHDTTVHHHLSPALHVLGRFFGGIRHDLAWRLEQEFVPGAFRRTVTVGATSVFLLVGLWVVPLWSGKPHQHCVSQQQAGANALNPSASCQCEQRVRPAGVPRSELRKGTFIARVICRP